MEDYDLRPLYPYDVSKACADLITKSYSTSLFKLPVITTRFSNIYGPGQLNLTALIPDCILANLKLRKFIPRGNGKNKRAHRLWRYFGTKPTCCCFPQFFSF